MNVDDARRTASASAAAGAPLHAVPHVAAVVATRGYTPGALTAPTVVAPFALWAWRRLRRSGVPIAPMPAATPLLAPAVVVGAHVAAAGALRVKRRLFGGDVSR
jgi:hypothetical protein